MTQQVKKHIHWLEFISEALDVEVAGGPILSYEPPTGESATDYFRGPRYPYPDDESLKELTSAQRRLVYEYFDRLNADSRGDRP